MSGPASLRIIGGNGGSPFDFTGHSNGATLRKIGVEVAGWQIKAVRAELSDGRVQTFGDAHTFKEYTFKLGERITKLSLWDNGEGTRLGAIRFWTSSGGEFFAKMTDYGLKTEYSIDVGSGVCLGVVGRAGWEIDAMGFLFKNDIQPSEQTQVYKEYIKSVSYTNDTTEDQEHTCEYSRTVTKSTTWSTTNDVGFTVSTNFKARILELVEVSGGFSLTVGASQTSSTTHTETITESDSVKVKIPAGKRVSVEMSAGRAVLDLEYSAKVKITCKNGSELVFDSTGQYNGVAYTAVNVKTTQSDL